MQFRSTKETTMNPREQLWIHDPGSESRIVGRSERSPRVL